MHQLMKSLSLAAVTVALVAPFASAQERPAADWTMSPPMLRFAKPTSDEPAALLDPCVVRHGDKWHLFAGSAGSILHYTLDELKADGPVVRGQKTSVAGGAVPQVYFHRATKKWHMILQKSTKDEGGKNRLAAVLSTNDDLGDDAGWSKLTTMDVPPAVDEAGKSARWMDFYVIWEGDMAHLFATSSGTLWRSETKAASFPQGWSKPVAAATGAIVYASHTYRQPSPKGERFVTIVTSSATDPVTKKSKQFQISYVAPKLAGPWTPELSKWDAPYAGFGNAKIADARWSRDIVHGEPIREENDERMNLEAQPTRFVFHARARLRDEEGAPSIDCLGLLERTAK